MTALAVGLPATATATDALLGLSRTLGYAGLSLLLGGAVFLALLWPQGAALRRVRWLLGTGVALGLAGAVLGLGSAQADLVDGGPRALAHLATYLDGTDTPVGRAWLGRALLWVLAVPLVRAVSLRGEAAVRHRAWRLAALVLGLALARAVGLTGHADLSGPRLLTAGADLVHVVAASVWIGGLLVLLVGVLPTRSGAVLLQVLPGFSLLALGAVTTVVAAGVVLSTRLVGSFGALFTSDFGQQLLLKLALLALLLAAGGASRSWVETRLDLAVLLDGDRATLRPVLLSVGTEAVLGLAVLAAAALLTLHLPAA